MPRRVSGQQAARARNKNARGARWRAAAGARGGAGCCGTLRAGSRPCEPIAGKARQHGANTPSAPVVRPEGGVEKASAPTAGQRCSLSTVPSRTATFFDSSVDKSRSTANWPALPWETAGCGGVGVSRVRDHHRRHGASPASAHARMRPSPSPAHSPWCARSLGPDRNCPWSWGPWPSNRLIGFRVSDVSQLYSLLPSAAQRAPAPLLQRTR